MSGTNGVFPELTIDVGAATTRGPSTTTASPLAQTVENALREVLAWRPKATDPKGFVAALNQVFTAKEVEGRTEFTWVPRSYAVQADMGAVTGAQASIYARAKAALDQSVPLIQGIYPLRADNDSEDVAAVRAVVINKLTELVNELGQVGGPRAERINDFFESLLGKELSDDPEKVQGLLGNIRQQFGLKRQLVNTIDEEQNLTNYLIVVDQVIGLKRSWSTQQRYFAYSSANSDVFLGTQLVWLSRILGVIAESVQELYFMFDSVFLGAAERQTTRLNSGLTIAELLGWVEHFATEEAPRIISEGGKDGVIGFRSTLTQLSTLVGAALTQSQDPKRTDNTGFYHQRIQTALQELTNHLDEAITRVDQLKRLPAPEVDQVIPIKTSVGNTAPHEVWIDILGANFQRGAQVFLIRKVDFEHLSNIREWGRALSKWVQRGQHVPFEILTYSINLIPCETVLFVSEASLKGFFVLHHANAGEWLIIVFNPDQQIGSQAETNPFKIIPRTATLPSEPRSASSETGSETESAA